MTAFRFYLSHSLYPTPIPLRGAVPIPPAAALTLLVAALIPLVAALIPLVAALILLVAVLTPLVAVLIPLVVALTLLVAVLTPLVVALIHPAAALIHPEVQSLHQGPPPRQLLRAEETPSRQIAQNHQWSRHFSKAARRLPGGPRAARPQAPTLRRDAT